MQEDISEKTIALYIKTGKLTAQQLQKAMKALLAQMKKQHDKQKIPHGKQTLKQLVKQNAGVSNIEITKDNLDLPVGKIVTAFVENGLEVSEAHTCEESLEDYFKRVTGGEGIA